MTVDQARAELEQYIVTVEMPDCPGQQWGWAEHEYAEDTDVTSDPSTWSRRTVWRPRSGLPRIRRSRQFCLFGDAFPTPKGYAAHIAWVKSIGAMLRRTKPAPVPKPHADTYVPPGLQANTWYWRELMPLLRRVA